MGVSINRGTPKWWFIVENPNKKWMIWGYPISGNLYIGPSIIIRRAERT